MGDVGGKGFLTGRGFIETREHTVDGVGEARRLGRKVMHIDPETLVGGLGRLNPRAGEAQRPQG